MRLSLLVAVFASAPTFATPLPARTRDAPTDGSEDMEAASALMSLHQGVASSIPVHVDDNMQRHVPAVSCSGSNLNTHCLTPTTQEELIPEVARYGGAVEGLGKASSSKRKGRKPRDIAAWFPNRDSIKSPKVIDYLRSLDAKKHRLATNGPTHRWDQVTGKEELLLSCYQCIRVSMNCNGEHYNGRKCKYCTNSNKQCRPATESEMEASVDRLNKKKGYVDSYGDTREKTMWP